ncbi:MAG: translation initiation factor IF-3 [Leptotrichiaceae bacterium]|jgi:translation initiation factor IF-3|nr:translation initiation factor IF-3 [Leptotrichiaceae bacterium]MBP6167944.1 translation initiation factor IF-3 [Leptotrichiaceae bacterium]MBP7025697.1 translation initiation factor IF-3 [Leptotrichiaceae bacterium]MBP8636454.1 translation initiation factor IF-3 [Leptotrichiaceae bacterium]MBP9538327.1 translation initiation factor IF-3 [Leptotrichiaceae bacterium]
MNEKIRSKQVRVVGEEGEQLGILDTSEALATAQEKGLDLVIISPNAEPPVCKMMDYGKFRFEKLKKDKENKKKQKQIALKELRIKPHIDEHDMNTKISQIKKFIEKEHKVKVSLRLLGREKAHADTAIKVLDEIASHFEEIAVIEKKYGREQVQKFIMLSPKVK